MTCKSFCFGQCTLLHLLCIQTITLLKRFKSFRIGNKIDDDDDFVQLSTYLIALAVNGIGPQAQINIFWSTKVDRGGRYCWTSSSLRWPVVPAQLLLGSDNMYLTQNLKDVNQIGHENLWAIHCGCLMIRWIQVTKRYVFPKVKHFHCTVTELKDLKLANNF